MKKLWLLISALFLAFIPTAASAQESVLLNGQNHLYTMQLRSDKKALVYARIAFTNASPDKELSTYSFSLPDDISAKNLSVQQILMKKEVSQQPACQTYETLEEWHARTRYNSSSQYENTKKCVKYNELSTSSEYDDDYDFKKDTQSSGGYYDYSSYGRSSGTFEYADLKTDPKGSTHNITLASAIKPKKQGSVLVSFTTDDFITGGFLGRNNYKVRTLVTKQMIDEATIAINFDEDLYSKQAQQKRASSPKAADNLSISGGAEASRGNSYESPSMDSMSSSVGKAGMYVKKQSSLLPGDTLDVSGVFATNKTALFMKEILIAGGAVLVFGILGFFGIKYYRRRRKASNQTLAKQNASSDMDGADSSTDSDAVTLSLITRGRSWEVALVTSVASSVFTALIAIGFLASTSALTSRGSELLPYIYMFTLLAIIIMGWLIVPLLYTLRASIQTAYRWALVHTALLIMIALILTFIVSGLDQPSYGPYDRYNSQ